MSLLAQISVCGFLPLPCATGGAAGAAAYTGAVILPALYYIFFAIALFFFFYYAVRLMLESEDSSTIDETKHAYAYAISGAVIVSLAGFIVEAVGPGYASATIINPGPVNTALYTVILFLRLSLSAAATAAIVYQGYRMILLRGQESELEQQKKRFFYGLVGVAVMILAETIVNSFLPGTGSGTLAAEIVGIINFLLEIFGALCILAFIVAGIMTVLSTDEGLKDRGKKAMFTTVVSLILVLASYVIIKFTVNVSSGVTSMNLDSLVALLIPTAHAQSVSGTANGVANGLMGAFSGGGFVGIVSGIISQFRLIVATIGTLIIVRAGMRLVSSQDEDKLTTARRTIASTCVGIMLAFLTERFLSAFYTPGGVLNAGTGASILSTEIAGIVDWSLVAVVVVAILMIVISALEAVGSFGKQDAGEVRRTVGGVMFGIALIVLSGVIKVTMGLPPLAVQTGVPGTPSASPIIERGVAMIEAVLSFLALAAVAVIIYAGVLMVLNFGKDDQYEKAKGIVRRAVIGLVIVLFSVVIVRFIVNLFI